MAYFRASLTWGALVGYGLYLGLGLLLTLLGQAMLSASGPDPSQNPVLWSLGCLEFFLLLFALSAAGFLAGRTTGRASAGAIAGMVALLVYGVLALLYEPGVSGAQPATSSPAVSTTAIVIAQIVTDVLFLAIAAGLGWLGGRPGAERAKRRAAVSTEVAAGER